MNLTTQTEWLTIENHINILGVIYGEDVKETNKLNWQHIIRGIKTKLWYHNPRQLNIIQKIILLNTYISSKLWYMASNIAITRGVINKIRTEYGKFIWYGQPLLRISFTNLTLPKDRGGLNLHCPDNKSKALLINRLMGLVHELPFLRSFIENNAMSPAMFGHIRLLVTEPPLLPDHIRNTPSSQELYKHYISLLPDPGFVSAEQRNWKEVFKSLHSKHLTSAQRSSWYTVMHKKN